MSWRLSCYFCCVLLPACGALQYATFDDASASSVYGGGSVTDARQYGPTQALSPASGYYCSAGAPDEVVTWTGVLGARRKVLGVRVNWAYSPGEFKILASPDGANYDLVEDWRVPGSDDVSFTEHVMFGRPANVQMLTFVLRKARPWGFYGFNRVELIVEPGPVLLVSGASTPQGFQCVVDGGAEGAALRPCADAIADGRGKEIFASTPSGMLKVVSDPDRCLVVSDYAGSLTSGSCGRAGEENPAGIFEETGTSQLSLPKKGDLCVLVEGAAGVGDVAVGAIGSASKSQADHPASAALDGDPSTYWAADFESGAIDLVVSLGAAAVTVHTIVVEFEYPARSFQVDLSSGGPRRTVYATTANNLNSTIVHVGGESAASLRIRMQQAHPV